MKLKVENIYGYPFVVKGLSDLAALHKLRLVVGAEGLKSGDKNVLLVENPAYLESEAIEILGYAKTGQRWTKTAFPVGMLQPNKKAVHVFKENKRLPQKLLVQALKASPKSALDFDEPHDATLKGMISRHLPPSLVDKFTPPKQAQKGKEKKAGAF